MVTFCSYKQFNLQDSDSEHLDFNTSQSTQRLNADSLQKILNDDVDDEEILFGLIDREDLPEFILNRDRLLEINKELDETNYLLGIINLIRRLMRIHDEVLNRWIGLDSIEETGISSIIAFIFDLIDTCFESICLSVYVQYDDLHVSIYDYTISMICSLIMTMNDEQISIVESLLFENLFSSTIKALMAADILCFMSRYCKSFAVELVEVLIKVMAEIYIEDVVAKEESKFFSISQTNLILLNLLRRILNFFPKNDLKMLSNLFLPGTCLSFQKNLSFQAEVISSNDTHELNKPILYDKLYLFSKLESSSDTLIEIFFLNFINSTTEYGALINLRLLQNLQSKLDYKKLCTIISKIQKFYTKKIFVNFCSEFTYNTLKFLNHLATINDGKLSDSSFQQKLYQLLSTDVWNECKTNYISQLNFFITLLNISCNKQFDQFLILISKNFVLNKLFQSHLKFSIAVISILNYII